MLSEAKTRFTPLRYTRGYDEYLICGIGTEVTPIIPGKSHNWETLSSYHIQRLKPNRSVLYPVGDMVEFVDSNPFDSLLRYFPSGKHSLIVCNNSLVLLGSSDFVACLEAGTITLAKGKTSGMDLGFDDETNYSTEQFIVSAPPTIVTFIRNDNASKYTIIDIANLGCRYLDDIEGNLGQAEREMVTKIAWGPRDTRDSIRNAALMARFMQEYYKTCKRFRLGEPCTSYAGQGLRTYRLHSKAQSIQTHKHKAAAELETCSYGLGRGEAFYEGHYKGECYLLDINSLYPYLGATREFPCELSDYQESPHCSTVEKWCEDSAVIMQCRVKTDEPRYRCKDGNKIKYPVGEFNCYLSGDECIQAIQSGHIVRIYRGARYRTAPILREYSLRMLDARRICKAEENGIANSIIKSITNGLWGKLAQPGSRWVVCSDIATAIRYGGFTQLNLKSGEKTYYRVLDGIPSKLAYCHFSDNTFPAISSVMNGHSRALLWNLITAAGKENVLYAAIDGFIVRREGYLRLEVLGHIQSQEIGKLRIAEAARSCYVKQYGVYSIGGKTAYVGMPTTDRHRTFGFWNQRSGETLDGDGKLYRTVSAYPAITPVAARQRLAEMHHVKGRFKAPVTCYQEPLAADHREPARLQPHFDFAAYGR